MEIYIHYPGFLSHDGQASAVYCCVLHCKQFPFMYSQKIRFSQAHTARIPSPLPLHVAKTGRNHLNEKFTPLLPTGIGERF